MLSKNPKGKIITLVVMVMVVVACVAAMPSTVSAYTIGIYDGSGSWDLGKQALRNFCNTYGYSWVNISALQINDGSFTGSVDLLWIPGGWANDYNSDIDFIGQYYIRAWMWFCGGRVIGTCAGAYFMSSEIVWNGDYYDYPMDAFSGVAIGAVSWVPWPNASYILNWTDNPDHHPINPSPYGQINVAYYGGPYFIDYGGNTNYQVVKRYYRPGADEDGEAACVTYTFGEGRVLLMGPHPEMGLDLYQWYTDGTHSAKWSWLYGAVEWVRYN
jgi:glutamine amidotransferase-like uncharacterized protein